MQYSTRLTKECEALKAKVAKIEARSLRWFKIFPDSDEQMRIALCNERLTDLPYLDAVNKVLLERRFDRLIDTPEKLMSVLIPISPGLKQFIRENRYRSFDHYNSVSYYARDLQVKVINGEMSFELANDIGEICLGMINTRNSCPAGRSIGGWSIQAIESLGNISNKAVEKYIAGLRELDEYKDPWGRKKVNTERLEEMKKVGLVSQKNVPAVIAAASRNGEELSDIFGVTCKMDVYGFNIDIPGTIHRQIRHLYVKDRVA